MKRLPCLLVCLLVPCVSVASFDERFDGDHSSVGGSVVGFSEPDWGNMGDGRITKDGFVFENSPRNGEPGERDSIRRFVNGSSAGFSHVVRIDDLDLGEITGSNEIVSSGRVQLTHFTDLDEGVGFFTLLSENESEGPGEPNEDSWVFGAIPPFQAVVPRGSKVELGMSYDATDRTAMFWYDPDRDEEGDAIYLGPFEIDLSFATETSQLSFVARGTGHSSGTLKRWRYTTVSEVMGDFNGDAALDLADINVLAEAIQTQDDDPRYDVNGDGSINSLDGAFWIHDLNHTYFGDTNLDGEFASSDLVNVFAAGEYEDDLALNSTWSTGDWDGDGDFTASDFVLAFHDGGYEQGPRVPLAVPEPTISWPMLVTLLSLLPRFR